MSTEHELYSQIFFPHSLRAQERVIQSGSKFAYYTTAATAYLILKNEQIWMRHTAIMNDYMEVEHGLNCILDSYNSDVGWQLEAALDTCLPGISKDIKELFNSWIPIIKQHTYVVSVSEHTAGDDEYGRLSMWRAYGGNAGVALILNGGPMLRPSDALNAYSMPVAYLNSSGVADELRNITRGILENVDYVRSLGRDGLRDAIFKAFRFAAICTKHPSFIEEQEWRVIFTDILHSNARLMPEIELIGGIPQKVLKLRLEDHPEEGLYGLQTASFIDRILIGPCEYPETVKMALSQLLSKAGVKDSDSRIHVTGIPLRPNQR